MPSAKREHGQNQKQAKQGNWPALCQATYWRRRFVSRATSPITLYKGYVVAQLDDNQWWRWNGLAVGTSKTHEDTIRSIDLVTASYWKQKQMRNPNPTTTT